MDDYRPVNLGGLVLMRLVYSREALGIACMCFHLNF